MLGSEYRHLEHGRRRDAGCCRCCCAVVAVAVAAAALAFAFGCHAIKRPLVPAESSGASLINAHLGGRTTYNYWNLPEQVAPERLAECADALRDRKEFAGLSYGSLAASKAAELMYNCTKVPGLFERVPAELRGVFWMKGNGYPEELVVMHMGEWFPAERTYVFPQAPFMWAWPGGVPLEAPAGGQLYSPDLIKLAPWLLPALHMGFSVKFLECPGRMSLPFPLGLPGHACAAGSASEKTYAVLQMHKRGDLSVTANREVYTMEADSSSATPGARWHRGVYGGHPLLGRCKCVSVGSYELTKIVDDGGRPIEPHFSDFAAYMGDTPIVLWSGVADASLRASLEGERIGEAAFRSTELYCVEETLDPLGICGTPVLLGPEEDEGLTSL